MIKKIVKENYIYIIVICLLTISLSIIMKSSLHDKIILYDFQVVNFMSQINNTCLTFIFRIFTFLGDFYIPLLIIVCIFTFIKNKYYFYILTCGYVFSGVLTYFIKYIVLRPRPLEALISIPSSYSFPSGHTMTSLVFYCLLCYLLTIKSSNKIKLISFIFATTIVCLIAYSRIYLGVHYFSDVLGGYLIGIPCLMMIINIIENNFREKLK